jgi:hypothetical protein
MQYTVAVHTLMSGVAIGITMVARMPSLAADIATPCAWLPALHATTPRANCFGVKLAILLYAPLILKLNTGCKSSRCGKCMHMRR